MLLKKVSFIAIIIVFYFLQPLNKKLRTLRKVKEGPGAYWSFREGQVVGGKDERTGSSQWFSAGDMFITVAWVLVGRSQEC